jgi:hypothetical protein
MLVAITNQLFQMHFKHVLVPATLLDSFGAKISSSPKVGVQFWFEFTQGSSICPMPFLRLFSSDTHYVRDAIYYRSLAFISLVTWHGTFVQFPPPLKGRWCLHHVLCHSPSLGFATKARACKGAGQKWARESHLMLSGVQENVREWTPTLPSELPLWKLESQWTLEFLERNCKGQNSLNWKVFYIIGKILELGCLKWAHMTHLGS